MGNYFAAFDSSGDIPCLDLLSPVMKEPAIFDLNELDSSGRPSFYIVLVDLKMIVQRLYGQIVWSDCNVYGEPNSAATMG